MLFLEMHFKVNVFGFLQRQWIQYHKKKKKMVLAGLTIPWA
jgi:hypothetical protein